MKNYKKVILTLLVAVLGMGAANAQLRFGVKAGLNLNSLSHLEKGYKDADKCGFTAGLMTEFQVPVIGICLDLSAMYTHMSSEIKDKDANYDLAKNFLEIPINLKYKIGLPVVSNIVTPFIFTGPSFAIRLDKNKKDITNLSHFINTKGVQTVWNVGIGVELIRHLQVQAGYGFGINNIAKKVADQTSINTNFTKLRNNYWTITAAWLF